jgi:hypothetical protein
MRIFYELYLAGFFILMSVGSIVMLIEGDFDLFLQVGYAVAIPVLVFLGFIAEICIVDFLRRFFKKAVSVLKK